MMNIRLNELINELVTALNLESYQVKGGAIFSPSLLNQANRSRVSLTPIKSSQFYADMND